jgi:hypothetical protein
MRHWPFRDPHVFCFDVRGDLVPVVASQYALLCLSPGFSSHGWRSDQYPQHLLEVIDIARPESEANSIHEFTVLRNIARQDTQAGTHRFEKSQG